MVYSLRFIVVTNWSVHWAILIGGELCMCAMMYIPFQVANPYLELVWNLKLI